MGSSKACEGSHPGPVTFARLSLDEHYADHANFVLAIARVLAQEAFELEAAGAEIIQIDEPALLDAPEDLDLAKEAIYLISSQLNAVETVLATYFGDAKRLGPELFELRVDGFGFDLISGTENIHLIKELPAEKNLQVGVVDARNTRLESRDDLARSIERIVALVGHDRRNVRLSPSAGLEFLPREKARAKLERLVEAVRRVA